jgi:hypothetical protein
MPRSAGRLPERRAGTASCPPSRAARRAWLNRRATIVRVVMVRGPAGAQAAVGAPRPRRRLALVPQIQKRPPGLADLRGERLTGLP